MSDPINPITTVEVPPKSLPLIPLRNIVVFPSVDCSLFFGRRESTQAMLFAFDHTQKMVIITTQRNSKIESPTIDDIYQVGVLARIEHILNVDNSIHAVIHAISRVRIHRLIQANPFAVAEYTDLPIVFESATETQEAANALLTQVKKSISLGRQFDLPIMMQLNTGVSSSDLADSILFAADGKVPEKQEALENPSTLWRLQRAHELLIREVKVAQMEMSIEKETQAKFDTNMKRNVLEERKRQIEKELRRLGKKDGHDSGDLRSQINKCRAPADVKKKLLHECKRLEEMGNMNPESNYVRTYLETMLELPWGKYDKQNTKINLAGKILNQDHYGLKDAKDRIIEYLSVMKLKSKIKNKEEQRDGVNILCFIGPPGVGKTSIGRSIAKALGRKFVRISLGGIRDEAEIRGHRRTYVGSMPGRIVKGVKEAGSMNPVFMLDEVDKIGNDFRGDPAAALLEALDPEQNKEFTDHYLDIPLDLSKVFFILTGNDISGLPRPLLDRIEVIDFSGYTTEEKLNIAKKYLVKKQLSANGLRAKQIGQFSDSTLRFIIEKYTRESGVRGLERTLAGIMRKIARKIVANHNPKFDINDTKFIEKLLGPQKFSSAIKGKKDEIGVATGLAWSSVGGSILFIEVNIMPGKGSLILTGKLGSVMKESCQAALSYVRSRALEWGIKHDFHKIDIHIHVPEGATPKDGPSAGCAITTAIISALKNQSVPREIGMTGEITLRGNVLEIGGLKEKAIAGHRAGLTTIFIPKENKKSLVDVPKEVQKDIHFVVVEKYDAIYKQVFTPHS